MEQQLVQLTSRNSHLGEQLAMTLTSMERLTGMRDTEAKRLEGLEKKLNELRARRVQAEKDVRDLKDKVGLY